MHDAPKAVEAPKVEVHPSNVRARRRWRGRSEIPPAADAVIAGMAAREAAVGHAQRRSGRG